MGNDLAAAPDSASATPAAAPAAATPGKATANLKHSFDLGEIKLGDKEYSWVKLGATYKAKGSVERMGVDDSGKEVSAKTTIGPTGGPGSPVHGGKGEINNLLLDEKFKQKVMGVELEEKLKDKLSFELSKKKLDISYGVEARVYAKELPWLRGAGDLGFKFVSVKWEDLEKDPGTMEKVKVLAVEGGLGLNGEGVMDFEDRAYKVSVSSQVFVTASPSWHKIGAEVAKQVAQQGATTGGTAAAGTGGASASGTLGGTGASTATGATGASGATGTSAGAGTTGAGVAAGEAALVIDYAGVAASASAIALPLAFAAAAVYGGMQMEKNTRASGAAIAAGTKLRDEGKAYVKAYVATLAGGTAAGQGALDANARVMEAMAAQQKSRADACADILHKNGGREGIETQIIAKYREQTFEKTVQDWESKAQGEFGLVEKIGETWGMRGVFRRELRGILFADWG